MDHSGLRGGWCVRPGGESSGRVIGRMTDELQQAAAMIMRGRRIAAWSPLFAAIPPGHPASGAIVMNLPANVLGLDNAATPLGLKAMKELQTLNPAPDRATDDMIMFMVINASSVTVLPISIFTFRAQLGAKDPTDVFVPILIATYCSTMCGLLVTAAVQRLNLWNRVVIGLLALLTG